MSDATLGSSLRLPTPGGAVTVSAHTAEDSCDTGVPFIGDAIDAACDVGAWLGDDVDAAIDAGIGFLDATTDLATSALEGLRASVRSTVAAMRTLAAASAAALARTPAGQVALDVVAIGRRFADTVIADCSDDAPDADGTGGSTHRVMVVAGINSSGPAWDRGPTVGLDVAALGYHVDEGEVRYFSYASDGGPYTAKDTHGPIEVSAAAARRRSSGRCSGKSRGARSISSPTPRAGSSSTTSCPSCTTPATRASRRSATSSRCRRRTRARRSRPWDGRSARRSSGARSSTQVEGVSSLPPPSSAAVRQLAEGSPLITHLWDQGVPDHFDFTTIGATEDLVVPATQISVPGATETVAAVDSFNEHSAIVRAPDALRAVRAALEGRPPPCVSLLTALRSAVAPVVISRVEHTLGSGAAASLGGAG